MAITTPLERYVNHPNFRRLEEKTDRFIIFMLSIKLRQGKEEIYFNIDKSARVANRTYNIEILKKEKHQVSRIG